MAEKMMQIYVKVKTKNNMDVDKLNRKYTKSLVFRM